MSATQRKMKYTPTPSQQKAIDAKNKTLLLSAAAGSGKTATLTQRIIKAITDEKEQADVSKMLIVTFTRSATADLREKIGEAITEALADDPANERLRRQSLLLASADICTRPCGRISPSAVRLISSLLP